MATRADFTPEEWKSLATAPFLASGMISAASLSGPIGVMREAFAVAQGVMDAEKSASGSPLLAALVEDLRERRVTPEQLHPRSAEELRSDAVARLRGVAELLDRKAADEAAPIKRWIYDIAQRAAKAVKEGGFLGFGGVQVSPEEQAALGELARVLGQAGPAEMAA